MGDSSCLNRMKIGIVTQPLSENYGGVLQNFALQEFLRKKGFDPITIDFIPPRITLLRCLCYWVKTLVLLFLGKRRRFLLNREPVKRRMPFSAFINRDINKTRIVHAYSELNSICAFDCLIVGSDQVWRPKYNRRIEDMYLKFAENFSIKRVAYAASFGVDSWEYTPKQTRECCRLAKKFDAISVREVSGIKLCKDYLDVNAVWVLDPTLLLTKEDYLPICEKVPVCNEKYLAVYVLDENEDVVTAYENEAKARGLVVKKFHADSESTLTVPEWLTMFRDASYVVTDSFHGTVFSIIFGKEFKCVYNKGRGAARFESLMNLYNSGKIEEMREFSIDWLKKALES